MKIPCAGNLQNFDPSYCRPEILLGEEALSNTKSKFDKSPLLSIFIFHCHLHHHGWSQHSITSAYTQMSSACRCHVFIINFIFKVRCAFENVYISKYQFWISLVHNHECFASMIWKQINLFQKHTNHVFTEFHNLWTKQMERDWIG